MINQLIKEVCEGCSKSINIGQAITECFDCSKISHTKCFKKSKFEAINGEHYCSNCRKINIQTMTVITHTIKNSLTVLVLLQKHLEFLKSAKIMKYLKLMLFLKMKMLQLSFQHCSTLLQYRW